MTERIAIIDADLVAYRCAAATEKRSVIATHKENLSEIEFDTATLFKEWAGDDVDQYDLKPIQTPEPIANTIFAMKQMLNMILEKTKCDTYHFVVSGPSDNNFRKHLPLPTRYKDNRSNISKPVNLEEAKQYLVDKHNAEVAEGEADDAIAGYKYQGYRNKQHVVSVTIDKDDNATPGWQFNWLHMQEPEFVDGLGKLYLNDKGEVKGCGRLFAYFQMVFGDPADCYKPSEIAKAKFGEKGAYKILVNCETDKEAVQAVVDQYRKWYKEPTYYTAWDGSRQKKDWVEIWQMYVDCVHMRRWDGDRLDVKKLCEKLGINCAS